MELHLSGHALPRLIRSHPWPIQIFRFGNFPIFIISVKNTDIFYETIHLKNVVLMSFSDGELFRFGLNGFVEMNDSMN
ncbi:hypothetical protein [Burkholderia mayonis]|nr:hypothetical protein [Burkholderia mayonis]